MMNALEYLKIKGEMTNTCKMKCDECPLYDKSNNKQLGCKRFEMLYPEEAIKIVEDWKKEHPIMTNKINIQKLQKKHLEIILTQKFVLEKMFQHAGVEILTVVNVKSSGAESIKRKGKNK